MDGYHLFTVRDLVWDDAFRNWVLRPTREDHLKWETWLRENPDKAETVAQARELVLALGPRRAELPAAEKAQAVSRIMHHFDEQTSREEIPSLFARSKWMLVACSVIIITVFAWLFAERSSRRSGSYEHLVTATGKHLKEVSNRSGAALRIELPDGSQVTLDPGSRLSFPEQFEATNRAVYLSGSAFFDVVKYPTRPFFVYADAVTTKVLGTSFRVRSYANEQEASVAVRTGRVAVFTGSPGQAEISTAANELSGVVIEPNQQITVARKTARMTKTLIPDPLPLAGANVTLNLRFNDSPVTEIFKTLQKAYGIEIIFDENTMKNCPVTATLTDLSLYEKLDLVCNAVDATYEVIDGRIIVDGKGCEGR